MPVGNHSARRCLGSVLPNDALGSPVAATDEAGEVLWREDYAPYGEKLGDEMEAVTEKVGYTGHRYDSDTGLTYAGARMYDPSLGRFMGIGPVGALEGVSQLNNPAMFNRYAYANNNPYKYVDPDGEFAIAALVVAAIFVIDTAISAGQVNEPGDDSINQVAPDAGLGFAGKALTAVKLSKRVTKTGTKGASGDLTTANGKTHTGNSTGSSASGGDVRAPMHPKTQKALDAVKKPSRTHGHCCEIDAINKALNKGDDVRGARMGPVKLNESGRTIEACSTCREVKKTLGVE